MSSPLPPSSILRVIYDDGYNVESLGAVGCRYASILTEVQTRIWPHFLQILPPLPLAEADPAKSHTPEYIASLDDPSTLRAIFELGSQGEGGEGGEGEEREEGCVRHAAAILNSQHLQYAGSLKASAVALEYGFAVNLGGGLHHASRQGGSGFCVYNDITACVDWLLETGKAQRILIIDLDAHQGNGYEEDLWDRCQTGQVCIFDAYEPMIFPFPTGEAVKRSIHYYIPYLKDDRGDCFIEYLLNGINLPFEEFQPDFVIYNAGTDTMEGDPVTRLAQTAEAIQDRDFVVIETCRRFDVPVMMCLSGGYGEAVPSVVAESLSKIMGNIVETMTQS